MSAPEPFIGTDDLTELTGENLIERASARVRNYCGWHIFPQITETRLFDTNGGDLLLLPTRKLAAVAAVALADGTPVTGFEWSEKGMISLSRYACSHSCWPRGFQAVTVTFTHGYRLPPDDVVDVVVGVGRRMPAQSQTVVQEAAGGVSRTYGAALAGGFSAVSGLTISETSVLDKYKVNAAP